MSHAQRCGGAHGAFVVARLRRSLGSAFVIAVGVWCVIAFAGVQATSLTRASAAGPAMAASLVTVPPPPAIDNQSWSGELAWASKNGTSAFDQVTGAWVQPAVAPSSNPEYADSWVGIDGYDGKLLQTGTMATARDGATSYKAWFVAWNGSPSGMTVLNQPVVPGDHMSVAIDRTVTGRWNVVLSDRTAGWTWSTTVTYPANGQTAEWIEEAPGTWSTPSHYQTLADYGSVTFTTVRVNGAAPTVMTAYEIAQHGGVVSSPFGYDQSSASFSVDYGPPAPAVASITPTAGPPSGGTLVVLHGQGFGTSPTVLFGGVRAQVVGSSTSSVVVRVPAHAPGGVTISVSAGGSSAAPVGTFEYEADAGYVVAFASGRVDAFGSAPVNGGHTGASVVGDAKDASTGGYWEAASTGKVYDVNAPDLGTLAALVQRGSAGTVASMAATPTGGGYWLVASDGGIFTFGNAKFYGSMGGKPLDKPVVGMAATPTGGGYWLVASDGGIFTFGNAPFYGSASGAGQRSTAVGMLEA